MKQMYLIKSKELYLDFLGKLKERGYTWSDGKELHRSNYWNLGTVQKFVELDFINLTARGVFVMTAEEIKKNKHIEWTMDMEPFKIAKENDFLTTKDFLEELDNLGYEYVDRPDRILIYFYEDQVAFVSKSKAHAFDTTYSAFYDQAKKDSAELYDLLDRYARTEIIKREQRTGGAEYEVGVTRVFDDVKESDYLTIEEFKKTINELDPSLKILATKTDIWIEDEERNTILQISNDTPYYMDTCYFGMGKLDGDVAEKIFNLAKKYAATPIKKRLEGNLCYLMGGFALAINEFGLDKFDMESYLETGSDVYLLTKSEAEKLKQKIIDSLEIVELEEE